MSRQNARRDDRWEALVLLWGLVLVTTGCHGVLGASVATTPANAERGPFAPPPPPQSPPPAPTERTNTGGESPHETPPSSTATTAESEAGGASAPAQEPPSDREDAEGTSTPLINDALDQDVDDALDAMDDAAVKVEEKLEEGAEEEAERTEIEAQEGVDAVEKAVEEAQKELEAAERRTKKEKRRRGIQERLRDDSGSGEEDPTTPERTEGERRGRGNRRGKGKRNKAAAPGRNNNRTARPGRASRGQNRGRGKKKGNKKPKMSAEERKEKRMRMMQDRSMTRLVKFLERRLSMLEKAVPEENRNEEMFNAFRNFLARAKQLVDAPNPKEESNDADKKNSTTTAPTASGETLLPDLTSDVNVTSTGSDAESSSSVVSKQGSGESPSETVSSETARALQSLRGITKINP